MTRQLHWAAAVLFLLPLAAESNSGIIQVTNLRTWSHPDSTRVIVETSGQAEFRADRAHNPDRLFFDVLHARPMIDGRRVATRQINDRLVKRIRVAETVPGTTRIVFDLAGAVEFTVSRLDTPDRLVIELTPARNRAVISSAAPAPQVRPAAGDTGASQAPAAPAVSQARVVRNAVSSLPAAPQPSAVHAPPIQASAVQTSAIQASAVQPAPARNRTPAVSARRVARRAFIPPVLPALPLPAIPGPSDPPALELSAEFYSGIPDSWTSLRSVKLPRAYAAGTATALLPVAPAPFVNTTTRVLPALHTSTLNSTPKASTDASLSLTRALGLKINRIVIDAGHGGHDDGTIGPDGVREKDVVLDVALRLATLVQTRLGAEVVLTRSDDTFVPLTERTAIANQYKADLFLSIHANSSPTPAVAGTETFLLNLNSSPGAISVAARENAGSDKSVGELRDLVQSITLNDKITESQSFAADIQSSIFSTAARANGAAHDRGVKKAPFVVLIGARMPSVLAEIGFLSNPRDESNLNKPEYRQKIAESLYAGISHYALSLSHFEIAGAK